MSPAALAAQRGSGSLFRHYARTLALLMCLALLLSGGVGIAFAYLDTRTLVDALQRAKARAAAERISQFLHTIEVQMQGALISGQPGGSADLDDRHAELLRLLRLAPGLVEAAWLDAAAREQIRVARIGPDSRGSATGRDALPAVLAARHRGVGYGTVRFLRDSAPQLSLAVSGTRPAAGLVLADLDLRFATDVVAGIDLGLRGHAYVVDERGRLVVHPDTSVLLRMADLSGLPQVRAALDGDATGSSRITRGQSGLVVSTHAPVAPVGWHLIVEQPLTEAFAPLFGSLLRSALLLAAGLALALAGSVVLARRLSAPIRTLGAAARRIGAGDLAEPVVLHGDDELADLAAEFNRMAARLRASHAELEHKVGERTSQLAEANRALTRFLAVASHDLRQPVLALSLFVAQLEETGDEPARRQLIGRVAAASAAVSSMLDALLDLSRLDTGAIRPQPATVPLQLLFDRVGATCALEAGRKGLRLRVRPTAALVHTDPLLLERILHNLCGNAVRYTRAGGVLLAARRRGATVRIEVRDTGSGIAPALQRRIFDEFYQAGAPGERAEAGLGLGLAIVDRLIALLGLRLELRSTPGRGTLFAITLAAATPGGAAPDIPPNRGDQAAAPS